MLDSTCYSSMANTSTQIASRKVESSEAALKEKKDGDDDRPL